MVQQLLLALLVACAWYCAANLAASGLFAASAPAVRSWLARQQPAGRILALRLVPATVSIGIVVALVLPAFAWLEPYRSAAAGERLGTTGFALALGGVCVLMASICRGIHAVWMTRRQMRELYRHASGTREPRSGAKLFISDAPIACVLLDGILKPRLLVSRSVVSRLTNDEFDRAVAHELAHHRARDNAKRRLMTFAPDLVSGTSLARELEAAWKHAAELEADAAAAETEAEAVALASALVKVARLAEGKRCLDYGRAAFHDGTPVATRVRALCERETFDAGRVGRGNMLRIAAMLALASSLALGAGAILPALHRVTEWMVHLP